VLYTNVTTGFTLSKGYFILFSSLSTWSLAGPTEEYFDCNNDEQVSQCDNHVSLFGRYLTMELI